MDNIRGSILMVLAMAGFALEDTFVKLLSQTLPVGQILILMGIGGSFVFSVLALLKREALVTRDVLKGPVVLRNCGELVGAFGYITALSLIPLSTVAAILQATPLCVTLGAALFMGETVGWRRWSAVFIGFFGVLLIIRPGFEGFNAASTFALIGVAGLAVRDLATRTIPRTVTSLQISNYAFVMIILMGIILTVLKGGSESLTPTAWAYVLGMVIFGVAGYYAIVAAMRIGDVSSVTPFRYTRLIFSLVIGIIVFAESPVLLDYLGATLIISSGFYTLLRERKVARSTV